MIRLYPTPQQVELFKKYIGGYRYVYNHAINYIQSIPKQVTYIEVDKGTGNYNKKCEKYIYVKRYGNYKMQRSFIPKYIKKNGKKIRVNQTSMQTLRKELKRQLPEWTSYMPSHLIDYALKEASQAFKSAITNMKRHNQKFFLKYKSRKKSITETIAIEKCFINMHKNTIFSGCMRRQNVNSKLRSNIAFSTVKNFKDGYLTYNRVLKTWCLRISYAKQNEKADLSKYSKVCALDPGERDFITGYGINHTFSIGQNTRKILHEEGNRCDHFQSQMNKKVGSKLKYNHRKRQGLRKKLHRQIKKIKDLKNELHWKTINFLCKNYRTIILPEFGTSKMVCNLNKKISRNLMKLSHYKFRIRLIAKAKEYGCKVIICTEEYTSKCCTKCGNLKEDLGSSKTYNCKECGITIDRDIGASRSILLKVLTELL